MDNKKPKIYCSNKNCSLFEKDLATGSADVTFIFCPRCTRKLFKENGANKKKPSQANQHNNNNSNYSVRSRSNQNTNRKQQNIPVPPSINVTSNGPQPDPTVVMLFEKMLNIISTSAR